MRLLSAWVPTITINHYRHTSTPPLQPIARERNQPRRVPLYIPDPVSWKPIHRHVLTASRNELSNGATVGVILHDQHYPPRLRRPRHLGTPPI